MNRYETRPLDAADIPDAAELLAARHQRHRLAWPALDPSYADPAAVRPLIAELFDREGASGSLVHEGGRAVAYVLGAPKDASWGANVWVEDAGSAGDPEAIRLAYAHAATGWAAAGRTKHYVVTPASDAAVIDAWFRLSFGLQHIHAMQRTPGTDFEPARTSGISVRPIERRDLPETARLGLVLPTHVALSPVFSRIRHQTVAEMLEEAEAEFGDPRFAEFVAEHEGRVVGITVACAISESPGNTSLMRPPNAGLLGHAAVDPNARGLGVGRALGERVLAWSRDSGHDWIGADWRSTNLEADRTWRSLGFRPTFYRLFRAID